MTTPATHIIIGYDKRSSRMGLASPVPARILNVMRVMTGETYTEVGPYPVTPPASLGLDAKVPTDRAVSDYDWFLEVVPARGDKPV